MAGAGEALEALARRAAAQLRGGGQQLVHGGQEAGRLQPGAGEGKECRPGDREEQEVGRDGKRWEEIGRSSRIM